jgi:excisionase family DNA binding protein
MKTSDFLKKLVISKLEETVNKINTGTCELTQEQAMDIMSVLSHEAISKEEACSYLNIHKDKFNNLVRAGKLPKGRKRRGFKELVYYKDELDTAVRQLRK